MRAYVILSALLLASCGGQSEDTTAPAESGTPKADAPVAPAQPAAEESPAAAPQANASDARPAKLAQCTVCHSYGEGEPNKVGPNLWNVHGQPAAGKSGFAYSAALRNAGITWDDATLDAYLENPRKVVPGGRMSFAGMRNEADRAEVIGYLATLKPDAGE